MAVVVLGSGGHSSFRALTHALARWLGGPPARSPALWPSSLPPSLPPCPPVCNDRTMGECKAGLVFGLPSAHWCYVQFIQIGCGLFL